MTHGQQTARPSIYGKYMLFQTIQGERVPALGLGTYRLKGSECRSAVEDSIRSGYRHIDTAQAYGNEEEVGEAWTASAVEREELFITTKVAIPNLEPSKVRTTTHDSLKKLRTEFVDLLLIHWPSNDVPLEKTLDAMLRLRDEGKVRHLGVSNFTPEMVCRAAKHAPIFANQVEYHPFLSQDELLGLADRLGYLLTAYSPIARGRVSSDETLVEIGHRHGKTPAQVALRWLIQQPNVAAIPKASSAKHRRENFDIFDFSLDEGEMERIFNLASGTRIVNPAWAPAW